MKFASLLSLATLTLFSSQCIAQNELPIMKPGDSIAGVLTVTGSDQYFERYNYHVAQPPANLVAAIPLTVDYNRAATLTLNSFQTTPLGSYGRTDVEGSVIGWVKSGFGGAVKPEAEGKPVRESIKKTLLSSRPIRDMLYNWLMPYYQKAFSIMSVPEQQGYLTQLNAAKEFATNLDIEKERKIVKKAVDYAGDVGHLHAFIYRRVANKELTKEECIEWLNRIITDLSAVKNNSPEPEDNYVVRADLGYGYFTASVYNAWDNYSNTYIMRKQNGKYTLVPGPNFDEVKQCGKNLLVGVRSNYPDPATYGYLYYDSLGSFYKEVPEELPSTKLVMKGAGRTGRALLFYATDYYEFSGFDSTIGDYIVETRSIGVCCVLDIDSGYVVQDSMYIPCVEKVLNDWGDKECTYPAANSDYMIFSDGAYGLDGMIGPNGNIILEPEYETIEATVDPSIFELNGKENYDVRTGKKTKIE
jgi:hypothetical protein